MVKITLKEALAPYKATDTAENIIPLLADEDNQRLVVACPKVELEIDFEFLENLPEESNKRWKVLWEAIQFCEEELMQISGVPAIKFERVFNQVKGNRLIYPDGTVSENARKYLENLALATTMRLKTDIMSSLERVQPKTKSPVAKKGA